VSVVPAHPISEVRIAEEDERLRSVSESTLWYIHDDGLWHAAALRDQRGHLGFLADEEHDLWNGMRLSSRLASVERNIDSAERRNDRVRAEILRRASKSR
jgi:hypothetical protein